MQADEVRRPVDAQSEPLGSSFLCVTTSAEEEDEVAATAAAKVVETCGFVLSLPSMSSTISAANTNSCS